ncbi:hypothetical protein N7448_010089 [Penicillium atrosanguineum]|nr:hypothetical protein N7448_010089 [Penicillium atrosanguineum]
MSTEQCPEPGSFGIHGFSHSSDDFTFALDDIDLDLQGFNDQGLDAHIKNDVLNLSTRSRHLASAPDLTNEFSESFPSIETSANRNTFSVQGSWSSQNDVQNNFLNDIQNEFPPGAISRGSSWASTPDFDTIEPAALFESAPITENAPGFPIAFSQFPNTTQGRRTLPRRRSRYHISRSEQNSTTTYIPMPSALDPMQRWQESPPEDEPASLTAIMNAMGDIPPSANADAQIHPRSSNAFRHHRRAPSTTSAGSSPSSTDSAWSSAGGSTSRHGRNRRSRVTKVKANDGKPHPSPAHLTEHHHEECQTLSKELRSFNRKDHLVQHLRHFHHVQTTPLIDDWKIETKNITSRCGFCSETMPNWDERTDHLAKHFRRGFTMKDWKGEHEFPPSIAAHLKNAYPPYLLGWESESIVPFSATSTDVRHQYAQVSSRVFAAEREEAGSDPSLGFPDPNKSEFDNFLNVFTRHLGRYARGQMKQGIFPTDEMFQKESRRVLFDGEDAWDQTIADNPDWLSAFRQLHCEPIEQRE